MDETKPKSKMGRPRKEIDANYFEGLCSIQCTIKEIAQVFKVSVDTIERWCVREYGERFIDVYEKFSAYGKISLRRRQFKLAEKNAAMAIWLGKQYLGQKELQEIKADVNQTSVSNVNIDFTKYTPEEMLKLTREAFKEHYE